MWTKLELNSDSTIFFKASKQIRENCLNLYDKNCTFLLNRTNLSPNHSFRTLSSCLFSLRLDKSGSGSKARCFWICFDAVMNRCSRILPWKKMIKEILKLYIVPDLDYDVQIQLCVLLGPFADLWDTFRLLEYSHVCLPKY